ncbi:MAG: transposase [Methanobrevibacter sp.]|nr:transposase [Methanobrevibacter sp.]
MSGKSTIEVLNKVNKTTLDEEIAKYVAYHRYYQRLIAIRIISEGHSIAEAARIIGKSYQTVHRWAKTCEAEGLEGLKPSFGGGRPSKLTYDQLIELDKIIDERPNMSMKDVHLLVNDKFNVDYSLKQIGKIVKKLGYNYSKAYPKFSKSPEDAEEQLKKLKRTQCNNKRYYSLI